MRKKLRRSIVTRLRESVERLVKAALLGDVATAR
jgi:hypothetical protein